PRVAWLNDASRESNSSRWADGHGWLPHHRCDRDHPPLRGIGFQTALRAPDVDRSSGRSAPARRSHLHFERNPMTQTRSAPAELPLQRVVRTPTRSEIESAFVRLRRVLRPTPLAPSRALGDQVLLKLETLQPTGSFKVRGAFAALSLLPRGSR